MVETAGAFRRRSRPLAVTRPPVHAGQRGGDGAGLRSEGLRLFQKRQRFFEVSVAREQASEAKTRGRGVGRRGAGRAQAVERGAIVVPGGLRIRAVLGDLSREQVGGGVSGVQADRCERRGFGQFRIRTPQRSRLEVWEAVVVRRPARPRRCTRWPPRNGVHEPRRAAPSAAQRSGESGSSRTPPRARRITSATSGSISESSGSGGSGRSGPPPRREEEGGDQDRGGSPEPEGPGGAFTPVGRRFRRGPVAVGGPARASARLV